MAWTSRFFSSMDDFAASYTACLSGNETQWQGIFDDEDLVLVQSRHLADWLTFRSTDTGKIIFPPKILHSDQGLRQVLEAFFETFSSMDTEIEVLASQVILFPDTLALAILRHLNLKGSPQEAADWFSGPGRAEQDRYELSKQLAESYHAWSLNNGRVKQYQAANWHERLYQEIFSEKKASTLGAILETLELWFQKESSKKCLDLAKTKNISLRLNTGKKIRRVILAGSAFLPKMSLRFLGELAKLGLLELEQFVYWPLEGGAKHASFLHEWTQLGRELAHELDAAGIAGDSASNLALSDCGEPVHPLGKYRVYACPDQRRQIEVLKEEILQALANDTSLASNQILVVCPDPAAFRPFVEAVFPGKSNTGNPDPFARDALPWHFLDTEECEAALVRASRILLGLVGEDLARSNFTRLLENPAWRSAYHVDEVEAETILQWIFSSSIHEGLDTQSRKSHGLPPIASATWQEGVQRLVLGTVYKTDVSYLPLAPCVIPTSEFRLLGVFLRMLDDLDFFCRSPQFFEKHSVEYWANLVRSRLLGEIIREWDDVENLDHPSSESKLKDLEGETGREQLSKAISAVVQRQLDLSPLIETDRREEKNWDISFEVWRTMLFEHLDTSRSSQTRALLQGVCFARFQPFRAIPFRELFFIGFHEGAFPAPPQVTSLGCFGPNREPARDQRGQDLYSFIELISCTKDRVHFLYQGREGGSRKRHQIASPVLLLAEEYKERFSFFEVPLHSFEEAQLSVDLEKEEKWQIWRKDSVANPRTRSLLETLEKAYKSDTLGETDSKPKETQIARLGAGVKNTTTLLELERSLMSPLRAWAQDTYGFRLFADLDEVDDDDIPSGPKRDFLRTFEEHARALVWDYAFSTTNNKELEVQLASSWNLVLRQNPYLLGVLSTDLYNEQIQMFVKQALIFRSWVDERNCRSYEYELNKLIPTTKDVLSISGSIKDLMFETCDAGGRVCKVVFLKSKLELDHVLIPALELGFVAREVLDAKSFGILVIKAGDTEPKFCSLEGDGVRVLTETVRALLDEYQLGRSKPRPVYRKMLRSPDLTNALTADFLKKDHAMLSTQLETWYREFSRYSDSQWNWGTPGSDELYRILYPNSSSRMEEFAWESLACLDFLRAWWALVQPWKELC